MLCEEVGDILKGRHKRGLYFYVLRLLCNDGQKRLPVPSRHWDDARCARNLLRTAWPVDSEHQFNTAW